MRAAYLDTSALVKLVVAEAESAALRDWVQEVGQRERLVTSSLAEVELFRAARRRSTAAAARAGQLLLALDRLTVSRGVLTDAASLEPPELRTLDALHLSSARALGASLTAFVAYDLRLTAAAAALALPVVTPA